jgi:hypothetical protein
MFQFSRVATVSRAGFLAGLTAVLLALPLASAGTVSTGNLLLNPGGELGGTGSTPLDWNIVPPPTGTVGLNQGTTDGIAPHTGSYDFIGDFPGTPAAGGQGGVTQDANLTTIIGLPSGLDPAIDSGIATVTTQYFEQSAATFEPGGYALGDVQVNFLNGSNNVLDSLDFGGSGANIDNIGSWTQLQNIMMVPIGTRQISYEMIFYGYSPDPTGTIPAVAAIDDNSVVITYPTTTTVPLPASGYAGLALMGVLALLKLRRSRSQNA